MATATAHAIEIRTTLDADAIAQLAALLIDAVDGGASVSFLPPLDPATATRFWRDLEIRARGVVVVARAGDQIDGVVVLEPAWAPNQVHRGEVAKLLVHRRARGRGLGHRLMTALVDHAATQDFTLLTLDTRRGDAGERLYRRLGWSEVGAIPDYARWGDGFCDSVLFYKRLA